MENFYYLLFIVGISYCIEEEVGEEDQQAQHAFVALMMSYCCTRVEPRSVDQRAKHVVDCVYVF